MEKNTRMYISSASPTITIAEQRQLFKVAKEMNCVLTKEEFISIMSIYGHAIDRILQENNMEEEDYDS